MASTNEDVDNCEDSSNLACRGLVGMQRDMFNEFIT